MNNWEDIAQGSSVQINIPLQYLVNHTSPFCAHSLNSAKGNLKHWSPTKVKNPLEFSKPWCRESWSNSHKGNGAGRNKSSPAGTKRTQQHTVVRLSIKLHKSQPQECGTSVQEKWKMSGWHPGQTKPLCARSVPSRPGDDLTHRQDWPSKVRPILSSHSRTVTDPEPLTIPFPRPLRALLNLDGCVILLFHKVRD